MKALILNSGLGSRMKDLRSCKCLVELTDGVTIFDMQISALLRCGISKFIITTGSNANVLEEHAIGHFPEASFTFVYNPKYAETNYIYSIYLAREYLFGGDVLLLHGDLVFEQSVLQDIIASQHSVVATDSTKTLPEKDFKAVIKEGKITYVGVDIPADLLPDAIYMQPLYKLLWRDWKIWLDEIVKFCANGETGVYAENAFNLVSFSMNLLALDVFGRECFEVDNNEDLEYAKDALKRMTDIYQTVYAGCGCSQKLRDILIGLGVKKPLLVSDLPKPNLSNAIYFDEFTSNPKVPEIMSGIKLFEKNGCDGIVSIGGGSAIDVAKCVNMLKGSGDSELRDSPRGLHLSVPTTAGTGSESTCFAVAYENGQKLSFEHNRMMPDSVILDPIFLGTLPLYHKKSSFLDAFAQAVESLWAKGQTEQSRAYALSAIQIMKEDFDEYFAEETGKTHFAKHSDVGLRIMQAANLSGRAINISKTTAAHAMSYRLSTVFGLAHGHAAAVCLKPVWRQLIETRFSMDFLTDADFDEFIKMYNKLEMDYSFNIAESDIDEVVRDLVSSVNTQRLGNHPIKLNEEILAGFYHEILRGKGR